jgi:integrase
MRWAEARVRLVLTNGFPEDKPEQPIKEVPTLAEFWPRFVDGYARANRQKPSGIASKESIGRIHLIPRFGSFRLDAITTEEVQRLKKHLDDRAAKTVNNVLTTLNVVLKTAVSWDVLVRSPCTIRLLPVPISDASFLDFDEYEALLQGAASESDAYVVMLLGGEAGLRCGEMMALASRDINWSRRQLCVQRSDWRGEVTVPKGGRLRYVPMTTRLATSLRQHRHLRSELVLCQDDGQALTQRHVDGYVRRAARRAGLRTCGPHVLRHYSASQTITE